MNSIDPNLESVKASIEQLITAGTTFDIETLEKIYHDELQVIMIDPSGDVQQSDKLTFKSLFEKKKKQGEKPLNTWSKLHHVEADENTAHVLISRKVGLGEQEQDIVLSIDLIKSNVGWQVTREIIFVKH